MVNRRLFIVLVKLINNNITLRVHKDFIALKPCLNGRRNVIKFLEQSIVGGYDSLILSGLYPFSQCFSVIEKHFLLKTISSSMIIAKQLNKSAKLVTSI